eukprot:CAMPEP_0178725226 /NCGR_PEP_ID=MMETSP0699-20121125/26548_1 /TAXON_ID=265572 /ORGANISM="Extubocellulus spinifer, Strain CCMP396" /LENGTH=53 /DNA_ID=CAMNT_0020376521 /DNA_START=86 /DNA_END=244 /DNA_ORIENTATION=+
MGLGGAFEPMSKTGSIEAVITAMPRHEQSAAVKEMACRMLKNLAIDKDNRIAI